MNPSFTEAEGGYTISAHFLSQLDSLGSLAYRRKTGNPFHFRPHLDISCKSCIM
jgi:hypothetical protein